MAKEKQTIVQSVILRPLVELVPNPKNPRTATDEEIAALAESIKANPDYFDARPIVLSNRTGVLMIIDGEQRSKAAKLLGMTEVPTILIEGLTEAQEDEIMVRGNTHAGKWSSDKLAEIAAQWGGAQVKKWVPDVKWDVDAFVKNTIPELAGLGKEKELKEILDEEGTLARERIIITFSPEQKMKVAQLLGIDEIKKVLYRFEEFEG